MSRLVETEHARNEFARALLNMTHDEKLVHTKQLLIDVLDLVEQSDHERPVMRAIEALDGPRANIYRVPVVTIDGFAVEVTDMRLTYYEGEPIHSVSISTKYGASPGDGVLVLRRGMR